MRVVGPGSMTNKKAVATAPIRYSPSVDMASSGATAATSIMSGPVGTGLASLDTVTRCVPVLRVFHALSCPQGGCTVAASCRPGRLRPAKTQRCLYVSASSHRIHVKFEPHIRATHGVGNRDVHVPTGHTTVLEHPTGSSADGAGAIRRWIVVLSTMFAVQCNLAAWGKGRTPPPCRSGRPNKLAFTGTAVIAARAF